MYRCQEHCSEIVFLNYHFSSFEYFTTLILFKYSLSNLIPSRLLQGEGLYFGNIIAKATC